MELVIASTNPGKVREIRAALDIPDLVIKTFEEFQDFPEPEETGDTLEENAAIKAEALCLRYGIPALADDSGLMVDALGGSPGVHSSRYAGPECDPQRNMDRLLGELEGVKEDERTARFRCVLALALPGRQTLYASGDCEGVILEERRGSGGFGYDPVFRPVGFERSMAELTLEEKNAISHRGVALCAMRALIENLPAQG